MIAAFSHLHQDILQRRCFVVNIAYTFGAGPRTIGVGFESPTALCRAKFLQLPISNSLIDFELSWGEGGINDVFSLIWQAELHVRLQPPEQKWIQNRMKLADRLVRLLLGYNPFRSSFTSIQIVLKVEPILKC